MTTSILGPSTRCCWQEALVWPMRSVTADALGSMRHEPWKDQPAPKATSDEVTRGVQVHPENSSMHGAID